MNTDADVLRKVFSTGYPHLGDKMRAATFLNRPLFAGRSSPHSMAAEEDPWLSLPVLESSTPMYEMTRFVVREEDQARLEYVQSIESALDSQDEALISVASP